MIVRAVSPALHFFFRSETPTGAFSRWMCDDTAALPQFVGLPLGPLEESLRKVRKVAKADEVHARFDGEWIRVVAGRAKLKVRPDEITNSNMEYPRKDLKQDMSVFKARAVAKASDIATMASLVQEVAGDESALGNSAIFRVKDGRLVIESTIDTRELSIDGVGVAPIGDAVVEDLCVTVDTEYLSKVADAIPDRECELLFGGIEHPLLFRTLPAENETSVFALIAPRA